MIASVYPEYLSEYEEVKSLRDSDKEQIESYVSWVDNPWHYTSRWNSNLTKEQEREKDKKVIRCITFFIIFVLSIYNIMKNKFKEYTVSNYT